MIRTIEEFNRLWDAPNTLHLERQTMAVLSGPDGLKMILHHGGQTLAFKFGPEEAKDLREALG